MFGLIDLSHMMNDRNHFVFKQGISLPENGVSCNVPSNRVGDVADSIPSIECADRVVKVKKSKKTGTDRMQNSRTRYCNSKMYCNFIAACIFVLAGFNWLAMK